MENNPYTAPLEHHERTAKRGRFAILLELTWAICAAMPILWVCGLFCTFLAYGGKDLPPTIYVRLAVYGTLLASLLLFLISFVYNTLAALKRRWIGILGVIINLLSTALIVFFAVLIVLISTGRIQ